MKEKTFDKVAIIGSGISGLSMARMLDKTCVVEILEKKRSIGGLIACDKINGVLFHKVGGHVFNSRIIRVLEWFWGQFDKDNEFLKAKRNAKILMDNNFIGYPIENHLYQLDELYKTGIINELLDKIESDNPDSAEVQNFQQFLVSRFGVKLYDLYFEPYNRKIWNRELAEIPLEWLEGKLPMPKLRDIILANILKSNENEMVHSTFYYPRSGGSQFIVDRLSRSLEISTSFDCNSIELTKDKFLGINGGERVVQSVVYTGDVRKLRDIIKIDDNKLTAALNETANLQSNGTSNVLCETDENDMSWLYLPERQFKAHRIIYTGNFSDANNEGSKRKTCVVEFSGKYSKYEMIKELRVLPGNLIPLAFNYEPNSYIIHDKNTRVIITNLKKLLKPYRIFLLGRFAEWEYYNMDKCIEAAMKLKDAEF